MCSILGLHGVYLKGDEGKSLMCWEEMKKEYRYITLMEKPELKDVVHKMLICVACCNKCFFL